MATLSAKRLMRIVCWGWQFGAAVGIATAMAQVLSKFSHSVVCLLFHAAARKINDVAHIHFAHRASYSPLEINGPTPRFGVFSAAVRALLLGVRRDELN